MDDLLSDFIAETRETLEAIAGEIVAWEANPADRARLDAIFRFVHTVKGSCGFLDLPRLARLSHAAEDALATVRAGERAPDRRLVDAVLAVIDRIRELADAIETGESLPDGDDQVLIAALAPGAAPALGPQPEAGARVVARSIRVPVDLLDRMMAGVSDLVLARNELARRARDGTGGRGDPDGAIERLSLALGELRDTITRTRMARIDTLFAALPRMVRDLAGELGREVALVVDGGAVELDREMIEMLRDPLTHIVRNAIDHGIEPPGDRIAAGKPRTGRLAISARQAGNRIVIEVADDGRGIDAERLVARAVAAGVLSADAAAALSPQRQVELVFEPGLSTRSEVTHISGRGVGMDVVRANVQRIGGRVEVESRPGRGLRLQLCVPLTLTIIPALTVTCAGQTYAIPLAAIDEIVRVGPGGATLDRVAGATIATIRGVRLPAVELASVLEPGAPHGAPLLVVLKPAGAARFALGVCAVHDHEELVVKPAAPAVMATGLYAGATLPDDHRPMLLLDAGGIAAAAGIAAAPPIADDAAEQDADDGVERFQALLFRALDGADRAIRLALVERIEDVPGSAATFAGGRLRLSHGDALLPLFGGDVAPDRTRLRILHLSDGHSAIAYAVDSVIDIVEIGTAIAPPPVPGPIAGVVRIAARTVELIDPHWLFAEAAIGAPAPGPRPLALLVDGETPWAREVLRPLVEAAGYAVTFTGARDAARADLVLAACGADLHGCPPAPVVRLRDAPAADADGASVWRYDRGALAAALGRHRAQGRG